MAATVALLRESATSPTQTTDGKGMAEEALKYLGERLAAVLAICDRPHVDTLPVYTLPRADRGARRGPVHTLLSDIVRGMGRRIPLTKLAELDADLRPYLTSLMISAMQKAGDALVIPKNMNLRRVTEQEFTNMLE